MEHRIDFIRRLFVVAITVGFASRVSGMEWFVMHRWPTRPEWDAIALLAVGLAAIIESWDGYFSTIAEKPQKTIARFVIDVMVTFAYLFLLLSSTYLPFFICIMTGIFLLYVLWSISFYIEYKEEFSGSPVQTGVRGKDSGESVFRHLALSLRDPRSNTYEMGIKMGITFNWTLYFFLICLITLAVHKDIALVVALFTIYGLTMYGVDKRKYFSTLRRSTLIAVAVLLFAIASAIV